VYVVPTEIAEADRPKVGDALCRALTGCDAALRASIADRLRKKKAFAWVRRQITPEEKRRIAALELEGVSFIKESRRFYPNGSVAAHALGWVSLDNAGLGGIELSYNKFISGIPGKALVQTDARYSYPLLWIHALLASTFVLERMGELDYSPLYFPTSDGSRFGGPA
jgi:stage V sporulation protein D (sporulation-specific penicillin-binding protein)